jgi:hypothetical protein
VDLGETVFELVRIGIVVAALVLMGWFCFRMRKTPYATPYWFGAGIYASPTLASFEPGETGM